MTTPSSTRGGESQVGELKRPTAESRRDRDAEILELRLQGLTLREIADTFGLTRERVRQICLREARANGEEESIGGVRRSRRAAKQAEVEAEHERLRRLWTVALLERPGLSADELLEKMPPNLDGEVMPRRIVAVCIKRFIRMEPRVSEDSLSKDEIKSNLIEALRLAATFEVPLSRATFDHLVMIGEIHTPLSQTVQLTFGSWSKACAAAGIECNSPARSVYDRQWSKREILEVIMDFTLDHKADTTFAGYESWRKLKSSPVAPSSALVRQRLGAWSGVMNMALDEIAKSENLGAQVQPFYRCIDGHKE